MRRVLVTALAVIGALTLVNIAIGLAIRQVAGKSTGIVNGSDRKPLPRVPVFLDRGGSAIERFVTDSAGAFTFPLTRHEFRSAVWLICPPGGIPMVDRRDETQAGPTTYEYTRLPDSTWGFRAEGWRGPIPRECPKGTDTIGWRYPASAVKSKGVFTATEPEWSK